MNYDKLFEECIASNKTKVRFNLDMTDERLHEELSVLEVKIKSLCRCHAYYKTIDSLITKMENTNDVFNIFPLGKTVSRDILEGLLEYLIYTKLLSPEKVADCFIE